MAEDFLLKSIILLGAGLVFVPIAKKLGLGSVVVTLPLLALLPKSIVTGKQIGRASCRERVCQYV